MSFSYTENEALQYKSSGSELVDFFKNAPIERKNVLANNSKIVKSFINAFNCDNITATKILLYLRDPRNGQGEKASARKILSYLYDYKDSKDFVISNFNKIVEYGSYKDLIFLYNSVKSDKSPIVDYFSEKLISKDRLACKWAPRLKSKNDKMAVSLRDKLKVSNSEYRKYLKNNSETIEQYMTSKLWSTIDYEKVPSVAMKKYNTAFNNHDSDRFKIFKTDDTKKVNASVLYPHQVVRHLSVDSDLAEKFWKNLPNYIKDGEKILALVDTSSSMSGFKVLDIAVSIGLYIAERSPGPFKDSYLCFSEDSHFIDFSHLKSLKERYSFIFKNSEWGGSTNFESSYRSILDAAVMFNVKKEDMPTMLICLSDMQFNTASNGTMHLENIRQSFKNRGYDVPKLVFWDLRAKNDENEGSPALSNDKDVALVSGFSVSILKAILAVQEIPVYNPYEVMMESVKNYEFDDTYIPESLSYDSELDTFYKFDDTHIKNNMYVL